MHKRIIENQLFAFIAMISIMLGSCNDEWNVPISPICSTEEICFSAILNDSLTTSNLSRGVSSYLEIEEEEWLILDQKKESSTKATPLVSLTGASGVFGYEYTTWSNSIQPITKLSNEPYFFNSDGELSTTMERNVQWKTITEDSLKIYTYAPYNASGISSINSSGTPSFTYTVPNQVEDQQDLIASDVIQTSKTYKQRLSLRFSHILTAIRFKIGFDCIVKSLTVQGVYNSGVYTLGGSWSNQKKSGTTLNYTFNFGPSGTAFKEGDILTDGEKTLMMIPQQLPPEAKVSLVYIEGGIEKTISANLKNLTWGKGKRITYTLHKKIQENDYIYFDLNAGNVNITPEKYVGWIYVKGVKKEITGNHLPENVYYVYQSTSKNYVSTGWEVQENVGTCRIPTYQPVTYKGKPWGEFITNNTKVEEVIEAWDNESGNAGAVIDAGREFTKNYIHIVGTTNFNCQLKIDNIYSRYQEASAGRKTGSITFFPTEENSILTIYTLGDNRLGSIHYTNQFKDNIDNNSKIIFQGTGTLTVASADFQQGKKDVSETYGYISNWWCSAIGAEDSGSGSACGIVIESGIIFAGTTQAENCTAIGGGGNGPGDVTITGGSVTAVTTTTGTAIGGGIGFHSQGGKGCVTITGGNVYAYNHCNEWFIPSSAIGGAGSSESTGAQGDVTISGGYVYAESALGTAIGGGSSQSKQGGNATVIISGGHVIAKSIAAGTFDAGAGIGGGTGCSDKKYKNDDINQNGGNATIVISGNPVVRTGSIGGGKSGNPDAQIGFASISMSGGDIQAQFVMASGSSGTPTFTMTGGTIRNSDTNDKEYIHIEKKGGAVYMEDGVFTMENGTIENCHATAGGAVYIQGEEDTKFIMTGGTIKECIATNHGGAVYLSGGMVTISGGTLQSNIAQNGNGGAVCIYDGNFTMTGDSKIKNNSALRKDNGNSGNGGGIYVASFTNDVKVTISSGSVIENSCDFNGGGLCVDMENSNLLKANINIGEDGGTTPTINKNKALKSGGGLYAIGRNSLIQIDGGSIKENHVSAYIPNTNVTNEMGMVTLNTANATDHIVVTYYANGSSNYPGKLNNQVVEFTQQRIATATNSILVTPIAQRDNYNFMGWNTRPDGRGTNYTNQDVVNLKEDLKLYAQWQAQ